MLHVNIWTSSYVAIDIYGAVKGDDFDHGVRQATIGLLIESVVAFVASSLMTRANAAFGVTNFYHFSALLYSATVALLFFFPTYPVFLAVMAVTGLALPAIYSSPFVLIEVHAADDDDEEEEEEEEDEEERERDTSQEDDAQREGRERRKEHRAFDISATHTTVHSSSSQPLDPDNSSASASPASEAASSTPASAPTSAGAPMKKRVVISVPSSHRASPEPSPQSTRRQSWTPPPAKETDALLSASFSSAVGRGRGEARKEELEEEDVSDAEEVYDIAFLDEWRGVLTGVYNVTMILAQIIVGLTSGLIIDWWGDIRIVFLWYTRHSAHTAEDTGAEYRERGLMRAAPPLPCV